MAASSDTSGLIIAGIIGGGAAIITQIIASWVTGKRENKRFDWEREQQDRTWERQERERFIDLKRELYCNFSFEVSKLMASIHMLTTPTWRSSDRVDLKEIRRLQWNIDMIAPKELGASIGESLTALFLAQQTAASAEVGQEVKAQAEESAERSWWDTYGLMRADLLGPEPQAARTLQPAAVAASAGPASVTARAREGKRT
jgi:hypothetical protein